MKLSHEFRKIHVNNIQYLLKKPNYKSFAGFLKFVVVTQKDFISMMIGKLFRVFSFHLIVSDLEKFKTHSSDILMYPLLPS